MSQEISETIKRWVKIALQNQNFATYKIELDGQSNKGDGYASDINFIKVTATTPTGETKIINLCLKSSKGSKKMREQLDLETIFKKEIYIYQKVRVTFEALLQEHGAKMIDFMPKCYGTEATGDREVLIFENLRVRQFEMWDRRVALTSKHIELVLRAYGRWHALSFALRAQKPQTFQELTKNNINVYSYAITRIKMDETFAYEVENAKKLVADNEEYVKLLDFSLDDVRYLLTDFYFLEPEYHVILHGDCWNNNYLFQMEDKLNPTAVAILDWQASGLASPVFDISHFIYSSADLEKHKDINELLGIYYDSFSQQLRAVGCDPEKLFSYELLLKHWRKFSKFGFVLGFLINRLNIIEIEEVVDLENYAENQGEMTESYKYPLSNNPNYLKRIKNNILHYYTNSI